MFVDSGQTLTALNSGQNEVAIHLRQMTVELHPTEKTSTAKSKQNSVMEIADTELDVLASDSQHSSITQTSFEDVMDVTDGKSSAEKLARKTLSKKIQSSDKVRPVSTIDFGSF